MSGGSSRRYPPELRERAVRMVAEVRGQHEREWAAMRAVSELLGSARPRQCVIGCVRRRSTRAPGRAPRRKSLPN